jgi:hypothetical protein
VVVNFLVRFGIFSMDPLSPIDGSTGSLVLFFDHILSGNQSNF